MENYELQKRVKAQRTKMGMSQEELADKSGLSLRTIQRIENGETVPRGDTLKRLAVALHTTKDTMNAYKKTAKIVGIFFLMQGIAAVLINQVLAGPVVFAPDFLVNVSANTTTAIA